MSLISSAAPLAGVRPREDEVNCGCSLVLYDSPPFCLPIDIIKLSNVEDVLTIIPSDMSLVGEVDNAFLLMLFLGHGVKSTSRWVISGGSYLEGRPSVRSDAMRSSRKDVQLFLVSEPVCSSLGLILDIIAFLLCLARDECAFAGCDCSFLHL